jgi:aryl-alcohol dehydrogenase-like predicted oxidoreductase
MMGEYGSEERFVTNGSHELQITTNLHVTGPGTTGAVLTHGNGRVMENRRIGSLAVSVIGLGCNNFGARLDAPETARVVNAALDHGITFFDTADIYGGGLSEEYLGRALGQRRGDVSIATKFGMPMDERRRGARPEYIARAAEDSLRRLGTDRIDLYQLHKPDPDVPIGETLGALSELVRAGKVREIGCSNFSAEQIREAQSTTARERTARFVSVQNEYNLLHREPEVDVLAECERVGAVFLPYSPLASGLLTGKYRRGEPAPEGSRLATADRSGRLTDKNLARVDALRDFARQRGHSVLDLAFAWLLAHPIVASVIAGAMTPEQVATNVRAADWRMGDADLAAIGTMTT